MNKHEARIAEIQTGGEKFAQVVGLIRTGMVGAIILGSIWIIMSGLQGLVAASEGQLTAMAELVKTFQLSKVIHYCADGVLVTGFFVQRRNAKRAIAKKAKYQKVVEAADPGRQSSGLTQTGETPNE
jgi:hypothetical protein